MDKSAFLNKVKELGLNTKQEYMAEAFSRNIGLFTQADQDKLANVRVAIPGMGGVGGVHLITMTRTGVGNFTLLILMCLNQPILTGSSAIFLVAYQVRPLQ